MDNTGLKLILTPFLVGAASLAGRRWGPAISGWLVGLPLTSGPIIFFLALSQGTAFARATTLGILLGTVSQALVCLAYGRLAMRFNWPATIVLSVLVFAGATLALQSVNLPVEALFLIVILALTLVLRFMPRDRADSTLAPPLPAWDIPARMIVATAYVTGLTGLAPILGPHLTGLLSPFPLYALTLAVFAHHLEGPVPAIQVLKGLLLGLFSFAGFCLVIASLIERAGIVVAFAAAIGITVVVQSGSLWLLRRKRGPLI